MPSVSDTEWTDVIGNVSTDVTGTESIHVTDTESTDVTSRTCLDTSPVLFVCIRPSPPPSFAVPWPA